MNQLQTGHQKYYECNECVAMSHFWFCEALSTIQEDKQYVVNIANNISQHKCVY